MSSQANRTQPEPQIGSPYPYEQPSRPIDFSELSLLRLAFNQIDYGVVLVDADSGMVQFANALGKAELLEDQIPGAAAPRGTGLRLLHGRVMAQRASDMETFRRTLERSCAGLRGFLCLGDASQSAAVAVVPLTNRRTATERPAQLGLVGATEPSFAMLMFSKRQACDESTLALFARERGLTSTESQILVQVCKGLRPAQIADNQGVRISTVRTQLRSIRLKTCSKTIRDLVQKVSVLPPMARQLSGRSHN